MKIELPQVGESVTEGIIGKWLKQVGDRIEKYDSLVEVFTDKVNMEMPSPVSGILTSILAEEGLTMPMGAVIAEIEVEGEEENAHAAYVEPDAIGRTGVLLHGVAPVGPTGSGGPISVTEDVEGGFKPAPTQTGRQRYSPAVQRLAEEHNVDLSKITGTGIGGRVTRKDVQSYIASAQTMEPEAATAPASIAGREAAYSRTDEERVRLTPVRRIIADNMVKSASQIPQVWSTTEVDVAGMVQRREAVKEDFIRKEGVNITYLAFVVKAVAESLKENPLINSSWGGDAIILKRRINVGIAVAAPNGLIVPVVHDADALSIAGLAKAIDDLTNRARQDKLALLDVQGGTFTVNNTGVLGSVVSQPLVNYPQAAIITTEAIVKRPVVINDAIAIRSMMNICLAFDHRILDGAEAGAFTAAVKRRLEAIGPDTGIY